MQKIMLAATAIVVSLASAPASALTFNFSFTQTDTFQDGGSCDTYPGCLKGTVIGYVTGLIDNMTGQVAPELVVSSSPEGTADIIFNPEFPANGQYNEWNVISGKITFARFSTNPFSLYFLGPNCGMDTCWAAEFVNGSSFTQSSDGADPFVQPTPLPAALSLFAGGLGVMAWLARRRKHKATAALAVA